MDGYLKANSKTEQQELHSLTLDDCDFIPDDEVFTHKKMGRKHTCPRCGNVTFLLTKDPYCNYCNWDSLEDQTNFQFD